VKLAAAMLQIFKDAGVLEKVRDLHDRISVFAHFCLLKLGSLTFDNAGNNNTLMEELEAELNKLDISFHRDGNRIR
jgi:hypothetical protein